MADSPMVTMLDDLVSKLKAVARAKAEADELFAHYTTAIKALIPLCEDENARAEYANALDEATGRPGFLEAVRQVLRSRKETLTPTRIRLFITLGKKLDLTQYSNPMASIHTTLRRMKQSGEIIEIVSETGEKEYRLSTLDERLKRRASDALGSVEAK